ncbi:MAG TPA: PIN domain-containing protein [Polyangiaceae bacterium]|nr:PIN domain-containing protein [Polyangiaceae bacterium]
MKVLVDTPVWSLALRRDAQHNAAYQVALAQLIEDGRVAMLGCIRQELLSGVRGPAQFRRLRERLRSFPDLELSEDDYEEAASCFNRCRSSGVQGSNTDFLICAVCLRRDMAIFTTDKDFRHYAKILHIKLLPDVL